MQYIDTSLPNIIEARKIHYKFLRYIIKKKLNGSAFSEMPPAPSMNLIKKIDGISSQLFNFVNDDGNLKSILLGLPEELDTFKSRFSSDTAKDSLKRLINYDAWIGKDKLGAFRHYNAYNLANKLDIPTCVYCNRIYTKTVITNSGNKITRPTFDHWFPKSDFPLLALSFHNLIPSCNVCNSGVKGSAPFSLGTHFHPYYKNPIEKFSYKFNYNHRDYDKFSFKIITNNGFSKRSVEAFQLEEIYKTHEDEIEDMRKIKDAYSDAYIDILETKILSGTGSLNRDDVYRLAFGVHYQEAKFDRRPLSKMKNDILKELGIIK